MFEEKTKKDKKETKDVNLEAIMPGDLGDDSVVDNVFDQIATRRKSNTLAEVTSNYLKLEDFHENEERAFIFTDMGKMEIEDKNTGDGKTIEVVNLLDENRQRLSCGAAVVVSALKKVDKIPCGIIIRVEGKKPGKDYYNARVFVLS
jgi:hypothetical protein